LQDRLVQQSIESTYSHRNSHSLSYGITPLLLHTPAKCKVCVYLKTIGWILSEKDVLVSIKELIRSKHEIFKRILLNEIFSIFLTLTDRHADGSLFSQVSRSWMLLRLFFLLFQNLVKKLIFFTQLELLKSLFLSENFKFLKNDCFFTLFQVINISWVPIGEWKKFK
jgi:hypothetical protein